MDPVLARRVWSIRQLRKRLDLDDGGNPGSGGSGARVWLTGVLRYVPLGRGFEAPSAVLLSPDGGKVYVLAGPLLPIDAATLRVGAAIALGDQRGIAMTMTSDGATIYGIIHSPSAAVVPVDTATDTAGTLISVGASPLALALTPDNAKLYVANFAGNSVSVIDTASGAVTATIPVGAGPVALAVAPDGSQVYVANKNDGTVTPIDVPTDTAGSPISVGSSAMQIGFLPNGQKAYVRDRDGGGVTPIDISTGTPGDPISVAFPTSMLLTADGAKLFVYDANNQQILPIDTTTDTPGTPIPTVAANIGGISRDGATLYLLSDSYTNIFPIDLATEQPSAPISVGGLVNGAEAPLAFAPDDDAIYVVGIDGTNGPVISSVVKVAYGPPA